MDRTVGGPPHAATGHRRYWRRDRGVGGGRPQRTSESSTSRRDRPQTDADRTTPDPLPSLRAAVVLALAICAGGLAGFLAHLDRQSLPGAVLIGGGVAGSALVLFDKLIDRR